MSETAKTLAAAQRGGRGMTKKEALTLSIGDQVFCKVHGAYRGWHKVTGVRVRDGYIRIEGFNAWCPPYNFTLSEG